jgi:hypothetical protein
MKNKNTILSKQFQNPIKEKQNEHNTQNERNAPPTIDS